MAKTYETYKDSGVEWIGEIPEDWSKDKIFRVFKNIGSGTTPKATEDSNFERNINWIQSGDINGGIINDCKNKISQDVLDKYPALKVYKAPFIVVAMYGASVGNISVSMIDGCTNQACCIMSNSIHYFDYLFYTIKSAKNYLIYRAEGGGQPNISQDKLKNLWLPVPSLSEQQVIASFLNKKCEEINSLITLQKEMIVELQAYKQSVITEAVTKGLDPNAKMKDSGVEWIGEIPENWKIQRLKFICTIETGNQDTQNADSEGIYPFYVRSPIVERCNKYTFEGEGILMAGDGAGAGRIFHHAFGKYAVHQRVYRLANIKNIESNFLFYFLSSLFCREMDRGSAQSTVPSVRLPMLQNFNICIPTDREQDSIVKYIGNKCEQIDSLISLKQEKIAELKDYKKSIIYEYVTGKKRV